MYWRGEGRFGCFRGKSGEEGGKRKKEGKGG